MKKEFFIQITKIICFIPAVVIYITKPLIISFGILYRYIYSGYIALSLNGSKNIKIYPHIKVCGGKNIHISEKTVIDKGTTLYAVNRLGKRPKLQIGFGVNIGESNHISCCNQIIIGNGVLTGKNVTITDNSHGYSYGEDLLQPPYTRPIRSKGVVNIGDNVWIGDKVVILPGVSIGENSIVGANSVVTHSCPPHTLICGNPAVIIKTLTNE